MTTADPVRETVLDTLSQVLDTPVGDLESRPALAAHHWDSMRSLETLTQLESRLGLSFDLREFHQVQTVDDMAGLAGAQR
jgi:acyl carrier protein